MLPAQPNASLAEGLQLLQALAVAGGPVGSRELARRLGVEPTRANRLLKTLAAAGYTQQDAKRRYLPGPGMMVLAVQALQASPLIRAALPVLAPMRRRGLALGMGVLWRRHSCYVYFAEYDTPTEAALGRMRVDAAETTGVGVALLATLSGDPLAARFVDGPPVGGMAALRRRLVAARRLGHALVERPDGTRSVAVVVGKPPGLALAWGGRFPPAGAPALVEQLQAAARRIEQHAADEQGSTTKG
ncbi:MAG: helix-turn-helix domain-containing protein [Phycisphaerae bacterium]